MSETHIRSVVLLDSLYSFRTILSLVEAEFLGSALSLSLSASFEMWRILELTSSQQDKGNGLVDMHTGIQYLRGIFRSSSFARHAYLICRYEYETWCFSIPYTIRSRKKKKKEKRKGEKNQFAARENERTTV